MGPKRILIDSRSRSLVIDWTDGARTAAGFAALRRACRCGACRRAALAAAPPPPLATVLVRVVPVGGYGACLHFDDGHDRGIYPWVYLRELMGASP